MKSRIVISVDRVELLHQRQVDLIRSGPVKRLPARVQCPRAGGSLCYDFISELVNDSPQGFKAVCGRLILADVLQDCRAVLHVNKREQRALNRKGVTFFDFNKFHAASLSAIVTSVAGD